MEISQVEDKDYIRYYVKGCVMEVEEDRTHEFKGHRDIAVEEIPPWCVDITDRNRKTRSAISRYYFYISLFILYYELFKIVSANS